MSRKISPEIARKVRQIEIRTRRLLSGYQIGQHKAAQKGYGLEFEQLSDYQFGHDVRFIDWRSSARMNKLLVREYRDERSRTILIAFDCSASTLYGAQRSKNDLMIDIATVLIMAGSFHQDQVGLVLFSDQIELYVPPRRSREHVHFLFRQLCELNPKHVKTNTAAVFDFIAKLRRTDAVVFVVSDFIDSGFEKQLRMVNKRNEVVAIRCLDQYERKLPAVGLVRCIDSETNRELIIDSSNSSNSLINSMLQERIIEQDRLFSSCAVDVIDIDDEHKMIEKLIRFFHTRAHA